MEIDNKQIISGLQKAGLKKESVVLAHSSLSSFGWVKGGATTVIQSILDVIGPEGTLMVPTLTGNENLSADNPPHFDPVNSPCWTGTIPETLRKHPDAIRSLHPTHSVAALGRDAVIITQGHQYSITPCDELSPYGRLAELHNGYVLLLGVGHESSTLFHHVEEIVGVDYHIQPGFVKAVIVIDGKEVERHTMLHRYGTARNFPVMEPVFEELGIQKTTTIGSAIVRLVHAKGMVATSTRALRCDSSVLCRE